MEDSEKAPLVKRTDFLPIENTPAEPAVAQICCVESARLGRVPIIRTLFKKNTEKGTFSSSFAVLMSMLGAVVGTGNIWRFPRIVANHATEGGALAFILVWFMFLWVWSIPIILIEYGVGRFTKKSTVESYNMLIGPGFRFIGGFQAFVGFCLGSYYSVLVGWCAYYLVESCVHPLPANLTLSRDTWDDLQDTSWPVFFHGLAMLAASLSVVRGVATIEPVNKVIVPILLAIVVFSFYWGIFLDGATDGIIHMFKPHWASLKSSQLWLDAITQNAWDTGAGLGTFLTFATFMKRSQGAVKLGSMTPFFNNIVSLMCGILVFSTVFSVQKRQGSSPEEIIDTLRYNGPGNTGLTFIWMPLLYGSITGGRFLAVIFFLCLTFAGLSSLISLMELPIHVLTDFGFRRLPATITVGISMFLLGTASAMDANVLVNQDNVWAYALVLSGCMMVFVVLRHGVLKFRRELYNEYGIGDWPLPLLWVFMIVFVAPIEGVGLILWWIVESIVNNPDTWWQISIDSLATVLTEWAVVLLVFIGLNWWISPLVIYEPRGKLEKKVLGFLFKLTPRESPHTPPPAYTPKLVDSGVGPDPVRPRSRGATDRVILTMSNGTLDYQEDHKSSVSDVEL